MWIFYTYVIYLPKYFINLSNINLGLKKCKMYSLKPPKQKKPINIELINFPFLNKDMSVVDVNKWPSFQAIFNGKHIVVEDINDITILKQLGSYGEFGVFDKNILTDYRTLQNQILMHKKDWKLMELKPFKFPHNNPANSTNKKSLRNKSITYNPAKQYADNCKLFKLLMKKYKNPHQRRSKYANDFMEPPDHWRNFKQKRIRDYSDKLILSSENSLAHYYLLLEEAFFLYYTLECLEIRDENGSLISVSDCWQLFNGLKKDFPFFYAAYNYYRSEGWIVKFGHQFGGNYVLYKASPNYYHSSYVVVISINGQNSELLSSGPLFFGSSRVSESVNKDLIVCTVNGPPYEKGMTIDLTRYTVLDTIIRRFVPKHHRLKPRN